MNLWRQAQPAIEHAARTLDRNVTLDQLADTLDQSLFQTHRLLHRVLGETPKQFTLRMRLDRAAAALLTTRDPVLEIALSCGFESHEVFCRAFRKRFDTSPTAYRRRAVRRDPTCAAFIEEISRCAGLYHVDERLRQESQLRKSMEYAITKEERAPQPVLVIRRKVPRTEIAATIGAELPKVFLHAQRRGIEVAGFPITRYIETSVGSVTIETGMRVRAHEGDWNESSGEGDVIAETLPGGLTAITVHSGPYDQLVSAYAALEEWMAANRLQPAGAPWEAYLNDPADHPDPRDWKTEVCWPVR